MSHAVVLGYTRLSHSFHFGHGHNTFVQVVRIAVDYFLR